MTKLRTGWLWFMAAASPALLPLWLILRDGVDVHFWDEWDPTWAGMFVKAFHHQLTFGDLVGQHNEHRMLVPRLIWLAMAPFTHWNNIDDLLLGWCVLCVTSLGLLWLCRRTAAGGWAVRWFICNLLLFTPAQDQSILSGMGVPHMLVPAFMIIAFIVVFSAAPQWLKVILCLLLASAATYTNGNGALCWPLAGVLVAWSDSWNELKAKKWFLAALGIGFVVNVVLYLIHFKTPGPTVAPGLPGTAAQTIQYYLVFLGNPFLAGGTSPPTTTALVMGLVMLLLLLTAAGYFLYGWRWGARELCGRMLPWLAVAGFAVCTAALVTNARGGLGADQALQTRYVTSSLYLPIALVNLLPLICQDLRRRSAAGAGLFWAQVPAFLAAGLTMVQLMCMGPAIETCDHWRTFQRGVKAAVLLIDVIPYNPQLVFIFPRPRVLIEQADAINRIGYLHPPLIASSNAADIRASHPSQVSGARGKLDGYGQSGAQIAVAGWAIFSRNGQPADAVFLTYDNPRGEPIIFMLTDMDVKRPDIVEQTGNRNYLLCGWRRTIPLAILTAELNPVRIRAWALDTDTGKAWPLDGMFTVQR